ncbi:MAG: AMP-binding protein [Symbiopectobacterium sp.]
MVKAQSWNWQRLASHCAALAVYFSRQGVNPDDIVALRGKNSAAILFRYLALLQCGARVFPLNPQLLAVLLFTLLPLLGVVHFLSVAPPAADFPVSYNPLNYPDNVADETPSERQSLNGRFHALPY